MLECLKEGEKVAVKLEDLYAKISHRYDVKLHTNSEKIKYNDYTGRGFSLPRMWAQYANNNDGVCFVLFSTSKNFLR